MKKLAVLIPTFNGSEWLHRTIASCRNSDLDPSTYSIVVVDNASNDGSLEGLGPDLIVHVNRHNIGRTGNWNRAIEIAEERGFTYATFLFVGDEWLPGGGLGVLMDAMEANGSVLGMAALQIVENQGRSVRTGRRVTIRGRSAQVDSDRLLEHSITAGRLPFAPIQANIYRLFPELPFRFSASPENALNCDLEATVQFLMDHPGPVSITASPSLAWKERPGRFFCSQDPWNVFLQTRRTLERVSETTGIPVDWQNANTVAMLAAMREVSHSLPRPTRWSFQLRMFRYLKNDAAGLSAFRLLGCVWRKILFGHNYLNLSGNTTRGHVAESLATLD